MERVYVAGVYSYVPEGANAPVTIFQNMKDGIKAALKIWEMGFAPFCPWLDYQYTLMTEGWKPKVENFYAMSMAWLEVSDYMVVLPRDIEYSIGVQLEIDRAMELGIPIFFGVAEFGEFVVSKRYTDRLLEKAEGNAYGRIPPSKQGYVPTMGDLDEQPSIPQSCDCCSANEGNTREPCRDPRTCRCS